MLQLPAVVAAATLGGDEEARALPLLPGSVLAAAGPGSRQHADAPPRPAFAASASPRMPRGIMQLQALSAASASPAGPPRGPRWVVDDGQVNPHTILDELHFDELEVRMRHGCRDGVQAEPIQLLGRRVPNKRVYDVVQQVTTSVSSLVPKVVLRCVLTCRPTTLLVFLELSLDQSSMKSGKTSSRRWRVPMRCTCQGPLCCQAQRSLHAPRGLLTSAPVRGMPGAAVSCDGYIRYNAVELVFD